jgi:hypothetical protein
MSGTTRKKIGRRRFFLLAIGLVVLCAVLAIVVSIILPGWLNAPPLSEVRANTSRYDEAARLIEVGEISGGSIGGGMVALPPEYEDLSPARDGQVIIYREDSVTRVLFYLPGPTPYVTWVYMYTSDDSPMNLHGECSGIERERPNWYFFHCP